MLLNMEIAEADAHLYVIERFLINAIIMELRIFIFILLLLFGPEISR
jgi:hypothetical protein